MKKIFFLIFLISSLTYSKEIKGFINFLDKEDLEKLETEINVNEYIEKKYPNKYYILEENGKLIVMPRLQYINIKESKYRKDEIISMFPNLKIGMPIDIRDNKIYLSDIIERLNNINLYIRYTIDENGNFGILIDDETINKNTLDLELSINNENHLLKTNYKNTYFNASSKIDIANLDLDLKLDYLLTNFNKEIIYDFSLAYNNNLELGLDIEKNYHIKNKNGQIEEKKPSIYLGYNIDKGIIAKVNFTNYIKFNNNTDFLSKVGIKYEGKKNIYFETNNKFNIENLYYYLENEAGAKISLYKLDEDKLIYREDGIFSDKNLKGDYYLYLSNKFKTLKISNTYVYLFNDFNIFGSYDNSDFNINNTLGLGYSIDIKKFSIDNYIANKIGNKNKNQIIIGINFKTEI